ncbi:MAG: hypothetical protein ABIS07_01725 [Dokdonella sp.]
MNAKRIDANTIESKQRLKDQEVGSTTRAVSAGGKTLSLVSKMTTAKGLEANTTMVYDRQ